jgi:hypothetical protein
MMAATCEQLAGKLDSWNRTVVPGSHLNHEEVKGALNDVTNLGTPVRGDVAQGVVADVKAIAQEPLNCLDQRQRPVSNVLAKEETGKGGKQDGEIATTLSIRSRQAERGTGKDSTIMYTFTGNGDAVGTTPTQSFNFTVGGPHSLKVSLTVRIPTLPASSLFSETRD